VSREKREVKLNGSSTPRGFMSNKLNNTKYNLLSFIPVVLFNQFKFFYNLFFLLISLSQFIPPLKVGFLITYIAPLGFVLVITLFKEAVDDISRYRKDKELNNAKIEYYNRKKNAWQMKSS
jgi:phospholipid-translocating ATPase